MSTIMKPGTVLRDKRFGLWRVSAEDKAYRIRSNGRRIGQAAPAIPLTTVESLHGPLTRDAETQALDTRPKSAHKKTCDRQLKTRLSGVSCDCGARHERLQPE